MDKKSIIRNQFFKLRKKKYFKIGSKFFNPLVKLIKNKTEIKKKIVSIYYPTSYEINVLKILENEFFRNFTILLPVIEESNSMNFYKWKKDDILIINKYGIPEPVKSKKMIPSIMLIPLLSFDKFKNRLGYGKGFYDKYLNKNKTKNRIILTIGVAFSFQKYKKLPTNIQDFGLDYIITEKGII